MHWAAQLSVSHHNLQGHVGHYAYLAEHDGFLDLNHPEHFYTIEEKRLV